MRNYYLFVAFLGIVVIAVIAMGFKIMGTPFSQRVMALDTTRLSDFSNIRYRIEDYYRVNKKLPAGFYQLNGILNTKDPETKQDYKYEVVSEASYNLCATFSTDSEQSLNSSTAIPSLGSPLYENKHKKGYDCITYTLPSYLMNTVTPYSVPTATITLTLTPTPTAGFQNYPQLRSCKLESEAPPSDEIKIMGIYELEDSVLFTTNRAVNAIVETWRKDPKVPDQAVPMSGAIIFDTKKTLANLTLSKATGYRIKIFHPSGGETVSQDYIFEGNRTVLQDPRCSLP